MSFHFLTDAEFDELTLHQKFAYINAALHQLYAFKLSEADQMAPAEPLRAEPLAEQAAEPPSVR